MNKKRLILVATLLFLYATVTFGLFLSKYEPSPSILVGEHPNIAITTPLIAGNKKIFEITSPFDGLGIIAVRFQTFGRINDDILSFRIKLKGASDWIYKNIYKTDQFQDHELFPFGFPLQPNSRGKTYVVELESLSGAGNSYVSVDSTSPNIVSKYHLPARGDRSITIVNILLGLKKAINLLSNFSSVFPIIVYLSPLLVLLINSPISLAVPLILISAQHILNLSIPYHWISSILLTWLIFLLTTKASYRISVVLSLLAALYLPAQILKNDPIGVGQTAIWLYYLLLMTIIQIKFKFSD